VSFNVLTIRSGQDNGSDALYPVLSDASSPEIIALDDYDGANVVKIVATAVSVLQVASPSLKTLVRLREVRIDVYITDGRLALACEKYDKGGGWVGFGGAGLLIAVTANTVSKVRAANRSRGKVLVGQVRYPWMQAVGASSKSGFGSNEAIRLEYSEKISGTVVRKLVELTLPKNIDATMVAQDITRRAAAFRLNYYPGMSADERSKFTALSQAPARLQPEPRKFAFQRMPTYYYAGAKTAFPRLPQSAATGPADRPESEAAPNHGDATTQVTAPSDPDVTPGTPQATNFCTQCGTRIVAGDNFCQQCGASVHNGAGHYPGSATGY
jgi:hypothetical protein